MSARARRKRLHCSILVTLVGLTWLFNHATWAGDWPQILGPQRNGVATAERPLTAWGSQPPRPAWTVPLGSGFAGPAVVGSRVLVFHRVGRQERLECLDLVSGRSQWHVEFPARYAGGVNPDNGPRCVPLVAGDRVYVFGAAGALHAVSLRDGRQLWSRDTYADYRGQEGYFGAGSTPLLLENRVLVNVGGRQAGIVAFDATTGQEVWKGLEDQASYSSPTAATLDGKPYAIFVTRLKCVAVSPRDGQVLFSLPFGKTGPTVNAATPLVLGDHLFLSASYGIGAAWIRLTSPPQTVWSNDETMSSQYTTCVTRDGFLYGIHGREDFGNGELRCLEASSGQVRWKVPGFGVGHLILVGEHLLALTTEGQLVLASASPERFQELARAKLATAVTRSLPAFSQGRLLFRDNTDAGDGKLYCLSLAGGE